MTFFIKKIYQVAKRSIQTLAPLLQLKFGPFSFVYVLLGLTYVFS